MQKKKSPLLKELKSNLRIEKAFSNKLKRENALMFETIQKHKNINIFKSKKLFEYRQKLSLIGTLMGVQLTSADPSKLDMFIIETQEALDELSRKIKNFRGDWWEEDKNG